MAVAEKLFQQDSARKLCIGNNFKKRLSVLGLSNTVRTGLLLCTNGLTIEILEDQNESDSQWLGININLINKIRILCVNYKSTINYLTIEIHCQWSEKNANITGIIKLLYA